MAFEYNTLTNLADLMTKLNTFLSTNGWTTFLSTVNGEFGARKTPSGIDIGFAAQWDTTTPDYLGIYQFHGAAYNSSFAPYDQNDDSGSGSQSTTNSTIANERNARISNTPIESWFFLGDHYFYVVVHRSGVGTSALFEHFGAGIVEKFNDWTGGEFVYGISVDVTFNSSQPTRGGSSFLLDGLSADDSPSFTNMEQRCATMHLAGMDDSPSSPAAGKYAVCMGNQSSANLGVDRQGTAGGSRTNVGRVHVLGGFRGGPHVPQFLQMRGSFQKGLSPISPIQQHHWNRTTGHVRPLGQMVDVGQVNINDYDAEGGDEIVIDGVTWVLFPSHRKISGGNVPATYNQGIAYKKT